MRTLIQLFFLCNIFLLSYSCSVEKRTYNHGYFIKWNHSNYETKKINKSIENIDETSEISNNEIKSGDIVHSDKIEIQNSENSLSNLEVSDEHQQHEELLLSYKMPIQLLIDHLAKDKKKKISVKSIKSKILNKQPVNEHSEGKKIEIFSLIGVSLILLALLLVLSLASVVTGAVLFDLALILGLIATILGVISLIRIIRNKDKYKMKILTFISLGSLLLFLIGAIFITFLIWPD